MAAGYVRAVRTAFKGAELVSGRRLLTQIPASCHCSRLLHVSPAASMCSSRTEQQSRRQGEEEDEEPEYIPRIAKNPMTKIGYAWIIGLPTGILCFVLAKRQVDKNRLKQLKVRQRMKISNDGEYEGSRYLYHREKAGLDR
ncbi:DUF4748 domain-containing protein [Solea solea]|uniref:DUF4748 domain-containing protein n=1 Tax=Solea solea TaxID=90069 RepID=UPI00272B0745|nr:DUF4748 domain-containing protein [Solea solea]XP_058491344.1 DUF4748 domain-containing protein [Solea solea]